MTRRPLKGLIRSSRKRTLFHTAVWWGNRRTLGHHAEAFSCWTLILAHIGVAIRRNWLGSVRIVASSILLAHGPIILLTLGQPKLASGSSSLLLLSYNLLE